MSAWAFTIVMVTKKNFKPLMCVDYRIFSQRMKPDGLPIPNIEEVLEDLSGCSFFTPLGLFSGY